VMGFVGIACQYIFIPIMSSKLGFRDVTITIIDIAGCLIQTIILANVTKEWMLYLGNIFFYILVANFIAGIAVAFLDSSSYAMIRCMITKVVAPDEIGKILALLASVQAFIPLISSPLFNSIYRCKHNSMSLCYCVR